MAIVGWFMDVKRFGALLQEIEEEGLTKVYSWQQLIDLGRSKPADPIPPKPEDLCTIMYTSGTTGSPKVGLSLT